MTKELIMVDVEGIKSVGNGRIKFMNYKILYRGKDVTEAYCKRTNQTFKDGLALTVAHKDQKMKDFINNVKDLYINKSLTA
jgi:hypothetical protein